MMAKSRFIALTIGLTMIACRDPEASSSSRVSIETTLVEQVCRGTVVHAASELARIEAELELAAMSERVEIHVIEPERIGEYCQPGVMLCVLQPPRAIYVSAEVYERVVTRELVRDRLARSPVGSTKPMFSEGIATALTRPRCRAEADWAPPSASELLSKTLGTSLSEEDLYVAGELLRWMLDTHGPADVLDFMATLRRSDSPNRVRLAYLERFAAVLEHELYAHWRSAEAPLEPERAGCVAPELPRDEARSRLLLETSFDCNSPLVRNDFNDPTRVFVEWTLTVDEHTSGYYFLDGELPKDVEVTLHTCDCLRDSWTEYPPMSAYMWGNEFHPEYGASLGPGTYRVRAYGPIGSSFEHEILAPCDYAQQNCPTGQQCTPWGRCEDQLEDPRQLGDSCWPSEFQGGGPRPCAAGLTCVGPIDGDGVCMTYCGEPTDGSCPASLSCEAANACTETCDPFVAGCEPGWSCIPNLETGSGGCYPFPLGELGALESCWTLEFACAPGLSCENLPELDGCHDPGSWFDFSGCCTPICDPAADDPGCPAELPNCEAREGHTLGTCQP
jgi:hypothetical protein